MRCSLAFELPNELFEVGSKLVPIRFGVTSDPSLSLMDIHDAEGLAFTWIATLKNFNVVSLTCGKRETNPDLSPKCEILQI